MSKQSASPSEAKGTAGRQRMISPQRRPLFIVAAALAFMAAIWFSLVFIVPKPPTVDQRVINIAGQLRCPVCQNESVADAPSTIAQEIRKEIRQQVVAGKSDQQIIQFFVDRYGEQTIIYAPQWQGFTLLMWLVPIFLMLGGAVLVFFVLRDWQSSSGVVIQEQGGAHVAQAARRDEERSARRTVSNPDSDEERQLARYRALLEEELAADDPLFRRSTTEA